MPFISIRDDQHPFLVFLNEYKPMPWHEGYVYNLMQESSFVRISTRGIQHMFFPLLTEVVKGSFASSGVCNLTKNALCHFDMSDTDMLFFPTDVVDIPDQFDALTKTNHMYLSQYTNASACSNAQSNRLIVQNDTRYEVSLCDLLDSNLDIVWHNNYIYWRQDTTSTFEYAVISIVGIYLLSLLTSNVLHLTGYTEKTSNQHDQAHQPGEPEPDQPDQANQQEQQDENTHELHGTKKTTANVQTSRLYAVLLLLIQIYLHIAMYQSTYHLLITKADQVTVIGLSVFISIQYVYYYFDVWYNWVFGCNNNSQSNNHGQNAESESQKTFSLIVAYVFLLITRVYYTLDTPYLTILSALFLFRSWHKFFTLHIQSILKPPDGTTDWGHGQNKPALFVLSLLADLFVSFNLLHLLSTLSTHVVIQQLQIFAVVLISGMLALSMVLLIL